MQPTFLFALVAAISAAPAAAQNQAHCPRQQLPPPLESAGFGPSLWPPGEVIRFSASPSFERTSYAVQITRHVSTGLAEVHVIKLVRERDCNLHQREAEWRFPLSAGEADQFFGRIRALEAAWHPRDDIIVADGTGFRFEHRRGEEVTRLRLSSATGGQTRQLSALILSVARAVAGDGLPIRPDWTVE